MPELLRNAGLAMAATGLGITCLTGCSTLAEQKVDSDSLYGTSADQSPVYAELTANNDSMKPQDTDPNTVEQGEGPTNYEGTIGLSISGELEELDNGSIALTTHQIVGNFVFGDSVITYIESDCAPTRKLQLSELMEDENGFKYKLSCKREGVEDNRPNVLITTEGDPALFPAGPHEGITLIAHNGDADVTFSPEGSATYIGVVGSNKFDFAQVQILSESSK